MSKRAKTETENGLPGTATPADKSPIEKVQEAKAAEAEKRKRSRTTAPAAAKPDPLAAGAAPSPVPPEAVPSEARAEAAPEPAEPVTTGIEAASAAGGTRRGAEPDVGTIGTVPAEKPRAPDLAADPLKEDPLHPATVSTDAKKPDAAPKAAAATARPVPARESESRGSVFFPALLGGIVAAGIGAVIALYAFPQGIHPQAGAPDLSGDLAALRAEIDSLGGGMDQRLSAIEGAARPGPDPQLAAAVAELQQAVSQLRGELSAASSTSGDVSAVEERLAAAQAEAARLQQQAAEAGRRAQAAAALSYLQAALESGAPLGPPLDELQSLDLQVPPALSDMRAGVPTLAALQRDFPPAARRALSAAIAASPSAGTWDRITDFLQAQTGARSTEPRAGTSPNAILSRAEAALDEADIAAALKEVHSLPEAGQREMSGWTDAAAARLAALQAAAGLAGGLN